jgi:hypothetical protein
LRPPPSSPVACPSCSSLVVSRRSPARAPSAPASPTWHSSVVGSRSAAKAAPIAPIAASAATGEGRDARGGVGYRGSHSRGCLRAPFAHIIAHSICAAATWRACVASRVRQASRGASSPSCNGDDCSAWGSILAKDEGAGASSPPRAARASRSQEASSLCHKCCQRSRAAEHKRHCEGSASAALALVRGVCHVHAATPSAAQQPHSG